MVLIMKPILKTKRGFTLVELMIVVVIMAILVAVAMPVYYSLTSVVEKRTCRSNMKTVENLLQNYQNRSFSNNNEALLELDGFTISPPGADGMPVYGGSADAAAIGAFLSSSIQKPKDICCNDDGVITVSKDTVGGAVSVTLECSKHGKVKDD